MPNLRPPVFRRRSATVTGVQEPAEDDEAEELALDEPPCTPTRPSSSGSLLSRELLSRSLNGSQTRKLQKVNSRDKHKRHSSYDFSSLSTFSMDAGAAAVSSQPAPPSAEPVSGDAVESSAQKPMGKLKRVSSRIWGNKQASVTSPPAPASPLSHPSTELALSPSTSPSKRQLASNGSAMVSSANAAVAQDMIPKRFGQGWFANLHPSSAEQPQQLQQQQSGAFVSRLASPLKAMSGNSSPRASNSLASSSSTSRTSASTSSSGSAYGAATSTPINTNRLFDRKWVDKAANYLFDTDANVDKCPDDIWLLGMRHQGYRDASALPDSPTNSSARSSKRRRQKKNKAMQPAPSSQTLSPALSNTSASSSSSSVSQQSTSTLHSSPLPSLAQTSGWPPSFYLDFISRIQLTYRSGFPAIVAQDVPSATNGASLSPHASQPGSGSFRDLMGTLAQSIGRRGGDAEGLTSDAGWGCMLRTGQSLLANALAKHHLGRDWRKPLPQTTALSPMSAESRQGMQALYPDQYARYARLLTWFLDDPAPTSPFSVHRFALIGKALGKEVGQWFGPSTAAGAIRTVCEDFPAAQMGVALASDATVYVSDVVAASESWSKPVLILLNLRLGISGVNPIYHPSIKALFTFPQSVGIAGGRPSSSYYFVGSQAESLFYIDPHYSKPAVPLPRLRPDGQLLDLALHRPLSTSASSQSRTEEDWERVQQSGAKPSSDSTTESRPPPSLEITSDESVLSEEDSWVEAEDPLQPPSPSPLPQSQASTSSYHSVVDLATQEQRQLDAFYSSAYAPSELSSFHPDRVRKMAISGMDPSMLVGFLVRSQEEMDDWIERSKALKPTIYSIQQNVPTWAAGRTPGLGSRTTSTTAAPQSKTPDSTQSLGDIGSESGRSDAWDISDSEDDEEGLGTTATSQHGSPAKSNAASNEEEDEMPEELNRSAHTISATDHV